MQMDARPGRTRLPAWWGPFNRLVVSMQRVGIRPGPIHVLTLPGRRTGRPRATPVALLTLDGRAYVIGGFPGSDWPANARATGRGTLGSGRRVRPVSLVEVAPDESERALRAYARDLRVGAVWMVRAGVAPSSSPDAFAALIGRCPVFRVEPGDGRGDGVAR